MLNFINKTKFLIIFSALLSCIFLIFSQDLVKVYNDTNPVNSLSKEYRTFQLSITGEREGFKEIFRAIEKKENSYLLLKKAETNIYGIVFKKYPFEVNIVSGRNLKENDFIKGNNVAIIDQQLKADCIKKGNNFYYIINSYPYKVVGIYKRKQTSINSDALAYYNLNNSFFDSNEEKNQVNGIYDLDAGKNTVNVIRYITSFVSADVTVFKSHETVFYKIEQIMEAKQNIIQTIFIIIVMILLNSMGMVTYWILGRRKEIEIRMLLGARKCQISSLFCIEHLVMAISIFMGESILLLLLKKINFYALLLGFTFVLLTEMITVCMILCDCNSHIKQLREEQ